MGEGITHVLKDLGVDYVIEGVAAVLPLLLKIKLMNLLKTLGKFTLKQLVMRQLSTLLKSLVVHVSYLENN